MSSIAHTVLRPLAWILIGTGIAFAVISMWLGFSHRQDSALLREQALAIAPPTASIGRRVELLNAWVYRNQGFAKNQRYFWIARLGPTPVDVLQAGGDCSDKSRLLSAMLREIGIESSLAMLYPCSDCAAVHTVVLARSENGWIAADPVYDITFPDAKGGYETLDRVVSNDHALIERVALLRVDRGPGDKINYYDPVINTYRYLTTINWKKNGQLRLAAKGLESVGYDPETFPRPYVLEDPKYALVWLFSGSSLALVAVGWMALVLSRRVRRLHARGNRGEAACGNEAAPLR